MTTITIRTLRRPHLEAQPTLFAKIFRGPMALVAAMRRLHAQNVAIRDMSAMNDTQLRDLGIHRSQIQFMVREFDHNGSRRHAIYSD